MSKLVCLITTNHIATNPRLVKEAAALTSAGYNVHLIFTQHTRYLAEEDSIILSKHPTWTYKALDWTGQTAGSKLRRLCSGLLQKSARICKRVSSHSIFSKFILNRHYLWQRQMAILADADLYIAHNVGALPVAADAAISGSRKFIFDAEDFHRGELLANDVIVSLVQMENLYIPKAGYITAASPLIADEYRRLYPSVEVREIMNVFPVQSPNNVAIGNGPLRLFWFSQTVGLNRGIQDVIRSLKLLEQRHIEFHVYGYLPDEVAKYFSNLQAELALSGSTKVIFNDPVSPDDLLRLADRFDIGMAIEPGFCKNNEIALSNKIFTYLAGGNAIIFSNTPAQRSFYEQHREIGFLYEAKDISSLARFIAYYDDNRDLLRQHRKTSHELFFNRMNWQVEQRFLLAGVEKILN